MSFEFDTRESDSPFVAGIWQTGSERGGSFISTAKHQWEMVVTTEQSKTRLTILGAETRASLAPIPSEAEFFGITFKLGTFMPKLPNKTLADSAIDLPVDYRYSVYLCDDIWEVPTFENADTFVDRLVKQGMLIHEPLVDTVLQNRPPNVSLRTVQRRFLNATGMSFGTFQQIDRAKQALTCLENGMSILDTVYQVGYADQPHLTRFLKRFMGQTPMETIQGT